MPLPPSILSFFPLEWTVRFYSSANCTSSLQCLCRLLFITTSSWMDCEILPFCQVYLFSIVSLPPMFFPHLLSFPWAPCEPLQFITFPLISISSIIIWSSITICLYQLDPQDKGVSQYPDHLSVCYWCISSHVSKGLIILLISECIISKRSASVP